ncbi:G-protein coupled receptor-associated protein LMBRD2-like [Actinia tenebrosa]|uniref:G-protein coupled receptor-associated protein LMBRD2-like n=1 Tax=Actinia tenebrosa TaxID=6105 RepID=A0A6P8I0G3_ACTTE|nr:G-protein coupled receptor-associated protein LMBRD2-like [Actinia tenebrosa]
MSGASLALEMLVCFGVTLCLLHYYGNWRKQHFLVTLAVFVAWYFSFLIVEVLPLDVSDTFYRRCLKKHGNLAINTSSYVLFSNSSLNFTTTARPTSAKVVPADPICQPPWSHLPDNVLPDLWRVVYWSSQILSWIILPIMQSYSYAGDFTVRGKIKTALFENAIWYGSYIVIFLILLVYVIARPDLQLDGTKLVIICITASNTWGLLLLVMLMGYGLVEIPRNVWNSAKLEYKLAHAYFKVSKLSVEREEAEEQLADVLEEVRKASENIRYKDPLRECIDIIIKKCPESSESLFSKGTDDYVDYDDYLKESGQKIVNTYSEKALVKLHRRVIVVTQTARRTQCQYNAELDQAFEHEDVMKNSSNTDRTFKSSFKKPSNYCCSIGPVFEWYWKIWISPILLRILAIILCLLSLALVWSEVTFFNTKPILSLCAIFINAVGAGYFYFYVELVSFFIIAYMCVCSYYTVFRMRIFNYYYFAPNHHTDPYSLLFSGLILCRLTYALSLNFLAMLHLDGHVTGANDKEESSFTTFMGHMDVLSFISKGVNLYYPMCVLLVCLATYFSLGTRCLNILGFQTFIIEDDMSTEYVNEGKDIVRRERRRKENLNGDGRKETWTERAESAKRRLHDRHTDRDRELHRGISRDQATSQTNLTGDDVKVVKYSRFDQENDRIELLSAADYDPDASTSGYNRDSYKRDSYNRESSSGFGWSPKKVPKNLFDDI